MGRRRKDSAAVSLFPFLSILVAIIGCLTLIIVVITISSTGEAKEQTTPEEVLRSEEYLVMKVEMEDASKKQDELKQLIENLIQENKDTIAARDKLKLLKDMLENQEVIEESRTELINQYAILEKTAKDLEVEHKKLLVDIKEKEEEIARRKLPPEPASLRVIGVGSSSTSKPYFVEIGNTAILIHRSLTKAPQTIPIATLNQSKEFNALLKEISSSPRHKLNFLIRGDQAAVNGFLAANKIITAYNKANGTDIIPGKLPLPSQGKVDLKTFEQFLEP